MAQIHEKLVEEWYRRNGYFTIRSAKASGNNEIDLLAQKIDENGKSIYRHIECQISFRPIGYISTVKTKSNKKRSIEEVYEQATLWVEKKFLSPKVQNIRDSFVNQKVNWLFTFVHHKVLDQNELEAISKQGIELIPFDNIKNSLDPKGETSSDARDEVELLRNN